MNKAKPEDSHFKGKDNMLKVAATKKQSKGTGTKIGSPVGVALKEEEEIDEQE